MPGANPHSSPPPKRDPWKERDANRPFTEGPDEKWVRAGAVFRTAVFRMGHSPDELLACGEAIVRDAKARINPK